MPTELRMRMLQALEKDRGEVCLRVVKAIGDHAQDPESKERALQRMREEPPTFRKVWKAGRAQGGFAAKFPVAGTSNKHTNEELVGAVDELVQVDNISLEAIERICSDVLEG
ncbi:MAG: hypothetical protein WD716_12285 [Fimbriimonadaceae bacterium]